MKELSVLSRQRAIEGPVKQFDFGSRLQGALLGDIIDCWTVVRSCLHAEPPLTELQYTHAKNLVDFKLLDDMDLPNENALVIQGVLLFLGKGHDEKDYAEVRRIFSRLREPYNYPQVWFILETLSMEESLSPPNPGNFANGTVYATPFLDTLAHFRSGHGNMNLSALDYAGPMFTENPPFSPSDFAQFCRVFGLITPLLKFSLWHPDAGTDVGLRYHLAKLLEVRREQVKSKALMSEIIKDDLDSVWQLIFADEQLTLLQRRNALSTLLEQEMPRLTTAALMTIATFLVKSACCLALNNVEREIPLYAVLETDYLGKEVYWVLQHFERQSLTQEARDLRCILACTQLTAVLSRSEGYYDQGTFGWVCKMLLPLEWSGEAMMRLCEYLYAHQDTISETVLSKAAKAQLGIILLHRVGMPKREDSSRYKELLVNMVVRNGPDQHLIDIILSDRPQLEQASNTAYPYVVATEKTIPEARRMELIERLRFYGEFCLHCHALGGAPCLSFREYYAKQSMTAVIDSLLATLKQPVQVKEGMMHRLGFLSTPDNSYDCLTRIRTECYSVAQDDDFAGCIESICHYLQDPKTRLGPNTVAFRLMEALAPHSVGMTVFKDWLAQKFSDKDLRDAYCAHLDVMYCETRSEVLEENYELSEGKYI